METMTVIYFMSARAYQLKSSTVIFQRLKSFMLKLIFIGKKWLLSFSYNSHKNNICNHLCVITKNLDAHYGKYENVVFLGDVNAGTGEILMESFCEPCNRTSPTHSPT